MAELTEGVLWLQAFESDASSLHLALGVLCGFLDYNSEQRYNTNK